MRPAADSGDPGDTLSLVLRILCDSTGLGFAAVTRLTETSWSALAVLDRIEYGVAAGTEYDATTTMCRQVAAAGAPIVITDVGRDPAWRDHPAPKLFRMQSYLGVPIIMQDGSTYGTICALDTVPMRRLEADLIPTLRLFAELVASQIAAQQRAASLADSQLRLGLALKAGRLGHWDLDLASGRLILSDIAAQHYGLRAPAEMPDYASFLRRLHRRDRLLQRRAMRQAVADGVDLDIECRILWPDATTHWIRLVGRRVPGPDGSAGAMSGVSLDVTERRVAEATLLRLAHHDPLTDLVNRRYLDLRITEQLARLRTRTRAGTRVGNRAGAVPRPAARCALLRLDLDSFTAINDTFGHGAGDRLLQRIAASLQAALSGCGIVARSGGDGFALLLTDIASRTEVEAIAAQVLALVSQPFEQDGRQLIVSGSVGVALAPDDALDTTLLWKRADAALYRAKACGRNCFRFFDPTMDARRQFTDALKLALPTALAQGELRLFYQPIVDLESGHPVGFEALMRWQHPLLGLLPPSDFVPLAEETGWIVGFGAWALHEACRIACDWPPEIGVSVNLSPVQFGSGDLFACVSDALAQSGLEPHRLELEVTESVLLQDIATSTRILQALQALGVRLVLDDFGTGYSSLEYLRRFTFDKVKIDKSLLAGLPDQGDGDIILRGIIALGGELRIPITVEGVETSDQRDFLRGTGCRQAQGFLFGVPEPQARLAIASAVLTRERPGLCPGPAQGSP